MHCDQVTTNSGTQKTEHLISAVPPPLLSSLFHPSNTLPHLTHNPSTSVGVVNLVFPLPPSHIHPDGFGYLIPRPDSATRPMTTLNSEGILGVVFDSTALPGLDDPQVQGKITKLTVMMGGPYWSTYGLSSSSSSSSSSLSSSSYTPRPTNSEQLLEPALRHLRSIFPILKGTEPIISDPHLHLDCIPTYLPGHIHRLGELHDAIRHGPWFGHLSLAGNGYGGVGVNDCIWSVEKLVQGLVRGERVTGLEKWARSPGEVMVDGIVAPTT